MKGIVLSSQGGIYQVETEGGLVEARLRGRLKRDEGTGERIVAGDRVTLSHSGSDCAIEEVAPRGTALVRKAPGKAPRPKPIVANVDQVVIVFAAAQPDPHLRMLDRFLVLAEANGLRACVVVNKAELVGRDAAERSFGVYARIGYAVIYTSAKTGQGTTELRDRLCGSVSVLTGPSGVGKSSLLNVIQPGLGLRVGAVSDAVNKGKHTTVTARLIPLECGGYVADTPGLREVGLWGVEPEELDRCFIEFVPFLGGCRYGSSCTHLHEPGCAVKAAVAAGEVESFRYESYRRLHEGDEESA